MLDFPLLSTLGSSTAHLLLALGVGLTLSSWVDVRNNLHRALLLIVTFLLAMRYIWWRGTETLAPAGWTLDMLASWSLFGFELLAMVGTVSSYVIMSRIKLRSDEADAHAGWWGETEPRVAILIATYNEEQDVLERTIVGARALGHRNKEVLILDDSRRDWLRDYCAAQGVRYMRRPDNKGSKAGNINHCLDRLAEDPVPPDFVAVLDADFVPHRGFISRCLALFHDPKVGLVQTPQHFFNADPIQHNLGISHSYPDEQRFFFDHMQPSRDGWGIAFCCGTSSVCRWTALRDIGGLPTESVTEDFMLTLDLQDKGWASVYLSEPLTEGLAPEGLKEYVTQRARWCLGLMQIARSRLGPLSKNNLRLRDRWSVADSVLFWTTSFPFRIAVVVYPLLYWYFGTIVVDAQLAEVLSIFGTFFLWSQMVQRVLMPGMVVPILHDVGQLIGAIPISRAAFTGLFKPKGHPFSVTAKGGDRTRITVQWRMMAPFTVLLALTIVGLLLGIFVDRFAYHDAGDGKWVVLFWTIYNVFVLSMTVLACVELPRRERHIADRPDRAIFVTEGDIRRHWITTLTMDEARLRGRTYPVGTQGKLRLRDAGDIAVEVIAPTVDGIRVRLLPTVEQREALLVRFYAEGAAPGTARAQLGGLIAGLSRRLSFSSGR
ncbi:glycosyltransferase [Paracoccus tibetensis]|uniref:Cellulose synthase (UDP-forming) n=1 Tax=Paracoccus tibetensis TaxID=336292 RepID=A0A1G5JVM5_9RHOB|nr:cellulose synthase catalytic subunit [Paracoccus tibetensis]SCY91818.1 cellulose synthase (UDP-forming) [Paracoccus tibetensis]